MSYVGVTSAEQEITVKGYYFKDFVVEPSGDVLQTEDVKVSGYVYVNGEPAPDITVQIRFWYKTERGKYDIREGEVVTDQSGYFEWHLSIVAKVNLKHGGYVYARLPDYRVKSDEVYVKMWIPSRIEVDFPDTVPVGTYRVPIKIYLYSIEKEMWYDATAMLREDFRYYYGSVKVNGEPARIRTSSREPYIFVECSFTEGSYVIEANISGHPTVKDAYTSKTINVIAPVITVNVDKYLMFDETVTIYGNVSYDNTPMSGVEVIVKLISGTYEMLIGTVTTDANGNYSISWTVPRDYHITQIATGVSEGKIRASIFVSGIEYYSEITVTVALRTRISLVISSKTAEIVPVKEVRVGEYVYFIAFLEREIHDRWQPCFNQVIKFYVNDQYVGEDETVSWEDPSGQVHARAVLRYSFDKPGVYRIKAVFEGTVEQAMYQVLLPSEAEVTIGEEKPSLLPLAILAGLIAVPIGLVALRR